MSPKSSVGEKKRQSDQDGREKTRGKVELCDDGGEQLLGEKR